MAEPTDTGHCHKSGRICFPSLHRPLLGGVFPQPIVGAGILIDEPRAGESSFQSAGGPVLILPVMKDVKREAEERKIELFVLPTAQAIEALNEDIDDTNAILHITC